MRAGATRAIEDVTTDPLLTGHAIAGYGVRGYLAVPLKTVDGHALGTLCVATGHPAPGPRTTSSSGDCRTSSATCAGARSPAPCPSRRPPRIADVGKLTIPEALLRIRGPLDAEQWAVMRTHPLASEEIVREVPGLERVARAVRSEHERWDGGGYPDGLAGEAIPLPARITLACDAYHAMISDRPTAAS